MLKPHVLCGLLAGCLLSTAAFAESPNSLTDKEKKEGWKLLFDGKTLKGWNAWQGRKPVEEGKWVVADGAMQLNKGGGDIYTADAFENYELSLEWKTTGNSGLLLRVDPSSKGPIYGVAPEMQIERDKGTRSTSAGGLYALYDIEGEKVIHPQGWNHVRIRLVDGHGVHWLNGQKLYEYQIGSDDWNARVAKSKFKNNKGFGLTKKGHIGLQHHGAVVSFRNLKIRELKSEK
ncbi:MAG: DUF1080 domain-containing protein [Planctomycetales bacterium]